MKKIIMAAALFAILFAGCEKPYEDKEIGAPIYSAEKMKEALNGGWVLRKALHVDATSLTNETLDITDFFMADGNRMPNIRFNTANKTYTSDTQRVAIRYFDVSGTWKFDDDAYPKKITLNNGTEIAITSNIQALGGYLSVQQSLSCGTEVTQTYKLELVKQ